MEYNEKCPICGTENKQLNLDETNGWFICEHCGYEVNNLTHCKGVKVPVLKTVEELKKFCNIS